MARTSSGPGGWPDKLTAFVNRWGTVLALALGALTLFVGLGKNGLWEPWEMDRADLARTLSNPPEAVMALGNGTSDAEVATLMSAAQASKVALKRPDEAAATALRATLDLARVRIVSAIVIDTDLLLPDPKRDDLWQQAGKLSDEALRYAAGAKVILLRRASAPPAADLLSRLALERARDSWESAATTWNFAAVWDTTALQDALAAVAADSPEPDLVVIEPGDAAALAAAFDDGASAISMRVAFKDKGELKTVAPLESWLRALSYEVLGATEFSTRLPGVLLCFLAFWVLISTVRNVWSPRVALISGLVLATMPLFFGQARIISGEPSLILATTLVACGFLVATLDPLPRRLHWAFLVSGLIIGVLGKGSYALFVFAFIALTLPLVRASKRPIEWAPAAMFLVTGLLVQLIASSASPGSFWGGLDFRVDMFSDGPALYSKTFDLVIRDLGFGMAPWSPFIAVSMGLLVFSALGSRDPRGLVVCAWFFLPIVAVMASMKTGNHFLFAGVGAAAIGAGLFVDRLFAPSTEPGIAHPENATPGIPPKYFIALALIIMFYLLRRELKPSPEPLVAFLAYDPPFAREGNLRFPETVAFDGTYKFLFIITAVLVFTHFGRVASLLLAALRWLRRPAPFLIVTGIVALLVTLAALISSGLIHGIGMGSAYADTIQPTQRALAGRISNVTDPMMVVSLGLGVVLLLVVLARWMFPVIGQALSTLASPLIRVRRLLLGIFAGLWLSALLITVFTVAAPSGYVSELALSSTGLLAAAAALIVAALLRLGFGNWVDAALAAVAVLALVVTTQLVRDASLTSALIAMFVALGVIAGAFALLPTLLARIEHFIFAMCAALTLIALSYIAVLVDRGVQVAEIVYATEVAAGTLSATSAARPLLVFFIPVLPLILVINWGLPRAWPSIVAFFRRVSARKLIRRIASTRFFAVLKRVVGRPLLYALLPALLAALVAWDWTRFLWVGLSLLLVLGLFFVTPLGRRFIASFEPRLASWLSSGRALDDVAACFQHRYVVVTALTVLALVGALTHLFKLEPAIAVNVSQKHILDTWFGDTTHGADSMYKHGSFAAGQGKKDSNFYTADIPEIRDRQAALKVLLAQEDQVLDVETPHGTETRHVPGFSPLNDKNGDDRRDSAAITGFATAVSPTTLTDATRSWAANSLVGQSLADASGRTWAIVANDATSVTVSAGERLSFALLPKSRAFYAIDAAGNNPKATAEAKVRRAVLLPADQLSDLNFAWRQLSGGRHLPVLDGSSYRVLLTTSWLEENEPQENRLAKATYDDKSFAALDDPRVKRVWGTFDDTIQLVGYSTDKDIVGTGSKLRLTLYFKTLKLVKKSLKLFIHMDKTGGGSRIQGDHWPLNPTRHTEENKNCNGCYRTDHWLVGDIVADSYEIEIPEGNTGEYMIWFGLYQPGPDTRAVVRDWDKINARHDGGNRLGIGTVRVK